MVQNGYLRYTICVLTNGSNVKHTCVTVFLLLYFFLVIAIAKLYFIFIFYGQPALSWKTMGVNLLIHVKRP
jgi:hypothetical protein